MRRFSVNLWCYGLIALLLTINPLCPVSAQENEQTNAPIERSEYVSSTYRVQRSKIKITEPVSLEKQQGSDLTHYLKPAELSLLLAGTNDFITLIQNELTSNSKGVAILLPDWQQSAASPKALNYLRKTLPTQGWTTISIQPYNKPKNYPSPAIKVLAQDEENKETLALYQKQLSVMMSAVMEKAKSYPGIFLVIVEGSHAALLVDLYEQEQVPQPNALIVLSSYMLTGPESLKYAQTLASSELPVLDLILKYDHPLAIENAKLRQGYADKELKGSYRQRVLSNFTAGYYPKRNLLTEINGWLRSQGW